MIFVFCAIYEEAAPIIRYFNLKKDTESKKISVFSNENIVLALTGCGEVNAAMVSSIICERHDAQKDDIIVNFGICAGNEKIKYNLFLINKIIEMNTQKTFYPDMLFNIGIKENAITTTSKVVRTLEDENMLYDMEAAAIYQVASMFVTIEKILIIKVVSDSGNGATVNITDVLNKSKANITICTIIEELLSISRIITSKKKSINQDFLTRLTLDMKCSETMKNDLKKLLEYCILSGFPYEELVGELYNQGLLPVKSKREGLESLDEFRKRVLQ